MTTIVLVSLCSSRRLSPGQREAVAARPVADSRETAQPSAFAPPRPAAVRGCSCRAFPSDGHETATRRRAGGSRMTPHHRTTQPVTAPACALTPCKESAYPPPSPHRRPRFCHTCSDGFGWFTNPSYAPCGRTAAPKPPHARLPDGPVPRPHHRPGRPLMVTDRCRPRRLVRATASFPAGQDGRRRAGLAHEPLDTTPLVTHLRERALRLDVRRLDLLAAPPLVVAAVHLQALCASCEQAAVRAPTSSAQLTLFPSSSRRPT